MAKKVKEVVITADVAQVVAALSTLVTGNLIAILYNKGVIDDDDVAQVIAYTRAGGTGDESTAVMGELLADSLQRWVRTERGDH